MPLSPGTRLGSYEVLGALGAGGMGEVYRAKDSRLGREVAIKVLPADVVADAERLTRFQREAKVVSSLNHPHIVTLHEVGASDSGPFIVMELIDGRSLREILDDGPMAIRRLLTIATQIAEGLAKAHAAGVVHRDLKPGNVMVTADGFAKILDFGLAKLVHPELDSNAMDAATTIARDTASGLVMGTVGYLSPEQAAGRPVDYRADQFAFGALLYEMATRERPFKRATLVESLAATINEDSEPLRSKRPDVPAPLEWLIDRCLSKDPGDRYASTSDLAREVTSLRDHLSDLTRLPSGETAETRVRSSQRWLLWVAGVPAAAALVAAGYFLAPRDREVSPPSFRPLTFQRGTITGARFAPDGRTIYYSAAYGAGPSRVYQTHLDRAESKLLDIPPGFLLGVSARQELAVLLTEDRASYASEGTLVSVPAIGGTPRPLVEDVTYADWGPDGEQLALVRNGVCEFPVGRSIVAGCSFIRISPQGDRVAVSRTRGLSVLDLAGQQITEAPMPLIWGLAWSADGTEVWFTGSETGAAHDRALYALDMKGKRRLITRVAGALSVFDVAPDGQAAIVATGAGWQTVNASMAGESVDRSLDLLGRSTPAGLSADGKLVLIDELREVGAGAYLRSTDGKETIPFLGYVARGLTPDGRWAIVHRIGNPSLLEMLPTRAGEPRKIPLLEGFEVASETRVFATRDGRRLFAWLHPANDPGSMRLFVRRDTEPWQAISPPESAGPAAVAPDGEWVAVLRPDRVVSIFSADGLPTRRLEGEHGRPFHWSTDGVHLFLFGWTGFSAQIYRRNLVTGEIDQRRTVAPSDPTAVMFVTRLIMADDDVSLVYQYGRGLNDLYLVTGVR